MNLLVCFKIYSDLTKIKLDDLEISEEMGVDTHFLPNIINCFDESSLEFAIRLKEKNSSIKTSALSISKKAADSTLKSLIALGYDEVIRIKAEDEDIRFNPEIIANNISEYVNAKPQDLILIGNESPLSNNSATAQLVSKKLNYPLITSVIDITFKNNNSVICQIENNNSIFSQEIKLPSVLSMGNAVISKLRMPTLRERMKNKSLEIDDVDFLRSEENIFIQPERIYKPKRNRQGSVYEAQDKEEIENIIKKEIAQRMKAL